MLFESIQKDPFKGLGKPEALKHNLTGVWSRRITKKDRIIYKVFDYYIEVYSLKDHY